MLVAGLMSGTSADGIDVAVAEITGKGWKTRVRLKAWGAVPYPATVRRRILEIAGGAPIAAADLSQMHFLLGELFARACRNVCSCNGIGMDSLELIGSHGQTVYHQGHRSACCGFAVQSTLQIGEPAVIAERTGVTTVADFRPGDVAAGGQGAPLVPFFDYLLYRHLHRGRIVLNLGGIANLTAIPAGGSPEEVIAFDTGPGNMLLDALAVRASKGRLRYDPKGRMAARGTVSEVVVERLLRQAYFRRPPPKTAGREQFGPQFIVKYLLNYRMQQIVSIYDAMATAAAFTAASVARGMADFVLPRFPVQECIVSGGGVKNLFLMEQLHRRIQNLPQRNGRHRASTAIRVLSSDTAGVPADAKEALAFAVLAYQTVHGQPSNLCAATGAHHPVVLGKVVYGKR